ncbi:sulfhydryl oxidase 1-like [Tropilaelaps mercedesae]|uniref:Sulfhydryl oxidase n=1 Tax=Tropilaelaps mercedesae TaxID=418985 RepID=A0A1V9X7R7_9ACAR|nr:sulfhydryl oxidase 1-like [Tropilaelaps mercedesae]
MTFSLAASLWLLTAAVPLVAPAVFGTGTLFYDNDDVQIINGSDEFVSFVFKRQNHSQIILFYSFTCPHCKRYAPIFREFSTNVAGASSFGSVLYDAADPINIVDGIEDFDRVLQSSLSQACMIEFYNSWCGHCIRYAPIFKEYANDVKGWQSAVDIGVINCASNINLEVCRDQEITSYPSIKMYWDGGAKNKQGEVIEAERNPVELRKRVINFLQKKVKEQGAPSTFPDLSPSRATSLEELWSSQPLNLTQILAVVEGMDSYVGREIILDFSGISHAKAVRFIRGQGPEEIKNKDATSLLLIEKGVHPRLLVTESDNLAARKEFKNKLTEMGFKFARRQSNTKKPVSKTNTTTTKIGDPDKIYLDDVEAGLAAILYQESMVHKEFNEQKLSILRNFIQAVHDNIALPQRIKTYLQKLHARLVVSPPLRNADYQTIVKETTSSTEYLRQNLDYYGCKGSVPNKRGYSCSLWTIFHLMTVGSHRRFELQNISDPQRVVLIVRDFVIHFFTCNDCVEHFTGMTKNIENELSTPAETVLWLWRAHNQVNLRTKGDKTEDPARPKVQFPPLDLCDYCTDASGNFIESSVLKFLHVHYDSTKLVNATAKIDRPIAMNIKQETTEGSATNARLFSGFDVTIFLVIYAVSITLLFGVFVTIVFRRRKGSYSKSLFRLS